MLRRKAKRFLAGLCVALMLAESVGECTLSVRAAEIGTEEAAFEETLEVPEEDGAEVSDEAVTVLEESAGETAKTPVSGEETQAEETAEAEDDELSDGVVDLGEDAITSFTKVSDGAGGYTVKAGEAIFGTIDAAGVFTIRGNFTNCGSDGFIGWTEIKKIRFEEGAQENAIGQNSFKNCTNLVEIDLRNATKLTLIDVNAFQGCTALTTIRFNEELQIIYDNVFNGCTSLESITLTKQLIQIGSSAFMGCTKLETIRVEAPNMKCKAKTGSSPATNIFKDCNIKSFELAYSKEDSDEKSIVVPENLFNGATFAENVTIPIPKNILEIGEGAFMKSNLKNVEFQSEAGSGLTNIKKNAFSGCTSLQAVTFPGTLQKIGETAFTNCTSLQTLVIPNTVTQIDKQAFKGCSGITSLTLSNATIAADAMGSGIFESCTGLTTVTIPEGLNYVAEGEFSGCTNISSLTLPSTLTNIKKDAFKNCASLTSVTIPATVTIIGDSAFYGCTALTKADLPDGLTSVGVSAFEGDRFYGTVLPSHLETIGAKAFKDCQGFSSLTIPASVTKIGLEAFKNSVNIGTLKLESLSLTGSGALGSGIFAGCLLREVIFPEGITEIPAHLFDQAGFTTGTRVTIPATVTAIGDYAFCGSASIPANLSGIDFEEGCEIKTIGNYAFQYCNAMEVLPIPATVTSIGGYAYANCINLASVVIPETVTYLGSHAFDGCTRLSEITFNAINVTSSNTDIFKNCNIQTIIFGDKVSSFPDNLFKGATFAENNKNGTYNWIDLNVPASVTKIGQYSMPNVVNLRSITFANGSNLLTIGNYAFHQCINLERCALPASVTQIGSSAFAGCTKLFTTGDGQLSLPADLTSLGDYAFKGCPGVKSVVIPEKVTTIGANAFEDCTNLASVQYNAAAVTSTGKRNIFKNCKLSSFTFGSQVTVIPEYLFDQAGFATDASENKVAFDPAIPAGVTKIGKYAFANMDNLKTATFANGSALDTIGEGAFQNCSGMTKCNLPDTVTKIEKNAFDGCTLLGSATDADMGLPESLTTLGDYAFQNCTSLKTITLPVNLTKLGTGVFKGDAALEAITFDGALTEIGESAFEGCSSLSALNVPSSVTTIKKNAFKDCTGLTRVMLPVSLTTIGDGAFSGCGSSIQFLVMPGSKAEQWLKANGFETNCKAFKVVTYVLNGGANSGRNPAGFEEGDTTVFEPATRKGYKFLGWYTNEGCTQEITSLAGQTDDLTIYAKWEVIEYTIDYELDGGTNDSANPTKYTVENAVSFKNPVMEGSTFLGWYLNPDFSGSRVTSFAKGSYAENVTLYAKWQMSPTAVPTADIASGDVRLGAKLALTCATSGANIYYTTNGTDPTKNSSIYTERLVLNDDIAFGGVVTIKAMAWKMGYAPSAVQTFVYNLPDPKSDWGDIDARDYGLWGNDARNVRSDEFKLAGIEDAVYNGTAVTFDIRVYYGKTKLIEKTDYTVKYANNKAAGDKDAQKKAPAVNVTFKGNYSGKSSETFTIRKHSLLASDVEVPAQIDAAATGKLQKPVPVVTWNGKKLKAKTDYTVSYPDTASGAYTGAGTWNVKLEGKGNFEGSVNVKFVVREGTSLAKAKIVKPKAVAYGEEPSFTVTVGKSGPLTLGKDYTVSYLNNKNSGKETAVITGIGSYCGSKSVNFTITPAGTMNKATIALSKTSVTYTGEPIEMGAKSGLSATVKLGNDTLSEGVDYTCTYQKNIEAGTATIVFAGKGKYSGTAKKTFKIDGIDINTLNPVFIGPDGTALPTTNAKVDFSTKGAKPKVKLDTFKGRELVEGKDYTISYENNLAKGSGAKAVVKGKKNFKGSKEYKFSIEAQDISRGKMVATDVPFKNTGNVAKKYSKITVKDADGNALVLDTDYKLDGFYYVNDTMVAGNLKKANAKVTDGDILPLGTVIRAKVNGMGNYRGSIDYNIRVYEKSITGAKLSSKIPNQDYTGEEVEIPAAALGVTVGGSPLNPGTEFVIESYENNVKKGTAKVTIRGVGEYGGSKTFTFKIVAKQFLGFKW